jgi:hypothetical protein
LRLRERHAVRLPLERKVNHRSPCDGDAQASAGCQGIL